MFGKLGVVWQSKRLITLTLNVRQNFHLMMRLIYRVSSKWFFYVFLFNLRNVFYYLLIQFNNKNIFKIIIFFYNVVGGTNMLYALLNMNEYFIAKIRFDAKNERLLTNFHFLVGSKDYMKPKLKPKVIMKQKKNYKSLISN